MGVITAAALARRHPYTEWERFWMKVSPANDRGCRLWTGVAAGHRRYGAFRIGAIKVAAHRYSYEQSKGPIPDGAEVLHKCDIGLCVSPDHLMIGTRIENQVDKSAKGRAWMPKGEANGRAKLTDGAVAEIRAANASGVAQRALARTYGVSPALIRQVVARTIWSHVK